MPNKTNGERFEVSDNGWTEYKIFILNELKRQEQSVQKVLELSQKTHDEVIKLKEIAGTNAVIKSELEEVKKDVTIIKVKATMIGGAAGALLGLLAKLLF